MQMLGVEMDGEPQFLSQVSGFLRSPRYDGGD